MYGKMRDILKDLLDDKISINDAVNRLKANNIKEINEIANFDSSRQVRTGFPEAILAYGKDYDDLLAIITSHLKDEDFSKNNDLNKLLITRLEEDIYNKVISDLFQKQKPKKSSTSSSTSSNNNYNYNKTYDLFHHNFTFEYNKKARILVISGKNIEDEEVDRNNKRNINIINSTNGDSSNISTIDDIDGLKDLPLARPKMISKNTDKTSTLFDIRNVDDVNIDIDDNVDDVNIDIDDNVDDVNIDIDDNGVDVNIDIDDNVDDVNIDIDDNGVDVSNDIDDDSVNVDDSSNEYKVGIVTAGTSDIPVAEEARVIIESTGCDVIASYDIGVAGIHRLFPKIARMIEENVKVIIVCAGMEGALPSVVSGLVDIPVIGIPTSVGYGIGSEGKAALYSMLQSCSPGLAVVNIDNGFGAAVFALTIINNMKSG
ncbi:N5-carboxyaminoimidazole ribonucleotide mutase [Methanobrevibacter filiformis]|uniref:N5-carboxyaminoimidazole ribonucleotide mutase n=1 Tax=Methanobrevibacter filiformis TaxID=55758 RepID=A0A165Z4K5_9EURY|nr:N5-carboxyaminoimidazole ribonucleotide mutase [Methanobrevibacter filiformis]